MDLPFFNIMKIIYEISCNFNSGGNGDFSSWRNACIISGI